jgi:isoquinoline 1-oxidoreductase subunit beta
LSAVAYTISVAKDGQVRVERVDIAHDEGFGLVNPLSVKKQLEGQVTWFFNDAMNQEVNVEDGRMSENNFDRFLLSRMKDNPPEINIRFFKSGHWIAGMGHDRATTIQSAICDAVFQVTGKRYRDLPLRNHDLTWT